MAQQRVVAESAMHRPFEGLQLGMVFTKPSLRARLLLHLKYLLGSHTRGSQVFFLKRNWPRDIYVKMGQVIFFLYKQLVIPWGREGFSTRDPHRRGWSCADLGGWGGASKVACCGPAPASRRASSASAGASPTSSPLTSSWASGRR